MKLGYARVSTRDQNPDLQIDQLRQAGCEQIFQETVSGASAERPVLNSLLKQVRAGDVIVIWKLDRLGRSLRHLVDLVSTLMEKGVDLKSLQDPIDTTRSQGRFVFNLFATLAEYAECGLMRSRAGKVDVPQAFCRRGTPHYPAPQRAAISASGALNQ